ncbi:MAG: hypothetical protein ABFR50_05920, partial [Candidatus Fermentibacteria bacterium]
HYLYRVPGTGITEISYLPHHKNLYMEPYEKMLMGEPYFELGADTIPFGSDEVSWEGTYNAADAGGLVLNGLQDSTRMILLDSLLLVKENETAPVITYDISTLTNPVVWINNGVNETVYLKTEEEDPERNHGLTTALTIGVNGNLCVSGPILYKDIDLLNDSNKVMLGLLVKEGNFTIAVDPDMVIGGQDWVLPDTLDQTWDISTSTNDYKYGIEVDAVIMVLDGIFQLEDIDPMNMFWWAHPAVDLEIVGSYLVDTEGTTHHYDMAGGTYGYMTLVTYDPRLMTRHPPFFPNTGVWDTAYWDERPDMHDVYDLNDPDYIGFNNI